MTNQLHQVHHLSLGFPASLPCLTSSETGHQDLALTLQLGSTLQDPRGTHLPCQSLGPIEIWAEGEEIELRCGEPADTSFRLRRELLQVTSARTAVASKELEGLVASLAVAALKPLLLSRGVPCLHGAVLVKGGRGLVLVGQSGIGKSTLALALVAYCGFSLCSEEIYPVLRFQQDYVVYPGVQSVSLDSPGHPDVQTFLAGCRRLKTPAALKPMYAMEPVSCCQPYPLKAGFFLEWSDVQELTRMSPAHALGHLMRNRFSIPGLPGQLGAGPCFEVLGQLAQQVTFYKASRSRESGPRELAARLADLFCHGEAL